MSPGSLVPALPMSRPGMGSHLASRSYPSRLAIRDCGAWKPAFVRGLRTVLDRDCDLINMSYGEPSSLPNSGRLIDLFSELVHEHGVVFVASAGNAGPALSTVGAPGGGLRGGPRDRCIHFARDDVGRLYACARPTRDSPTHGRPADRRATERPVSICLHPAERSRLFPTTTCNPAA